MRNWHPFIKDALAGLSAAGADRIIGIPLAPQFSTLSVQKYTDAARAALPAGTQFEPVPSFATHPLLVQAFAERLLDAQPQAHEEIVFTAHSLPVRVLEGGDPYADEVAATARDVAARAGVTEYSVAYQSAGRTPEPWVGPDVSDLILAARANGPSPVPRRADRVRVRPYGDSVRHRRAGRGRGPRRAAPRCGVLNR